MGKAVEAIVAWGGPLTEAWRRRRFGSVALPCLLPLLAMTVGCHHRRQSVAAPTPPARAVPEPGDRNFFDATRERPVFTETGDATWYYSHVGRHADGNTYAADAPTAAHKTLPMGSTVRVTNLATGQQTLVRITDRGPFVKGRILDLSVGAAREIGLYRAGVAKVRVEAFPHQSADPVGHWAVQTGPFRAEADALDLKEALIGRYRGARVAEFHSDSGYWVRIDPANHTREDAQRMEDWIGTPDPVAAPFLVRID